MALGFYPQQESPTWHILEHLQRHGASTIKELEEVLGVTTTAVRQHLTTLQAEGYIERRSVHTGVGRPHHAYSVTERARELFACHCDDLALTLLEEVFQLQGRETTMLLLQRVGDRLAQRYAQSVRSTLLPERMEELADALHKRGVLTDVVMEDQSITLKTYNCPFHELAQEHDEICEMDQEMIQQILGADVNLDLRSRIMDGHTCCSFVVARRPGPASQISGDAA
jgi:predicted ArsR family transcriptional regulator